MTSFVALPLVVVLVLALCGSASLGRLSPSTAARCTAVLLTSVTLAAVPTLWLMGLSGLTHLGFHNRVTDWSEHLLPDLYPIGALIGAMALALAPLGTFRAIRVLRLHRRLRCTDTSPLAEFDSDDVFAYTLPGPAKTIVVSRGLRESLDDIEYDLVVAHEAAHARHRHDRMLLLGLLAAAFVPPMRSVATRLEFYIERWADEEAIHATGVERRVAARTITKVALAGAVPPPALGIAAHGVAARVEALLEPSGSPAASVRLQCALVLALTVVLALSQIHHSAMFASELLR